VTTRGNRGNVTDRQRREDEPPTIVFNTFVDRDDEGWCLMAIIDGITKVISRHRSEEAAIAAQREVNESGNRGLDDPTNA
jgi:hypothetical protein